MMRFFQSLLSFFLSIFVVNNELLHLVDCALVRLEKYCFENGDFITVRFVGLKGTGVFVGLYEKAAIPNPAAKLPSLQSGSLKDWILTCGKRDNCNTWPDRGLVQFSTNGLVGGNYIIAVSGDSSGLTPQSTTKTFHVGSCSAIISPVPSPSAPSTISRPITLGPTLPAVIDAQPRSIGFIAADTIIPVIQEARNIIFDRIRLDGDLVGKFIRLSFHDCIGGCNGCVDMTNPDNAGLAKPISVLDPIVQMFTGLGLTRTDIWMLSALVATESALPPDNRDISLPLAWIGRMTCEELGDCGVDFNGNPTVCSATRGPHVLQPHGTLGTSSIQQFFEEEFNFNPQQVTALMGAHSVGQMHRENSGHIGKWDLSSTTFDGGYWIELIGQPPDFFLTEINNDDLPNIPNRLQWQGVVSADSTVTMLNADLSLVRNLRDLNSEGSSCDFNGPNPCSRDTPFMPFATQYNSNPRSFLEDFSDVLILLTEHGHSRPGICPSGRICTFGSGTNDDIIQIEPTAPILEAFPIETDPVSNVNQSNNAIIFTDKSCYNTGETIVINYDAVLGTNVWIGILLKSDVADLQNLPASPDFRSDLLIEWTLSCGHRVCHTWLSNGGFQFPANRLGEEVYVVVVSGDGGSRAGQALANFRVGRC